ncbi:ATP-binding protein [Deinococcus hopiensis]|uniref:histidine kinase n=1 Tax=Deinococcus hopiensis KR-140 TaxID=695939 RepID=A0A1W1UER0_9DEIO|nr:ATP-binding protein [Deinococcus hopiensis]SMB79291.1 Bacteriophytochrome (light-regulated signal transduction histidine kinase) [Deinococcus hopiensis KR-140]
MSGASTTLPPSLSERLLSAIETLSTAQTPEEVLDVILSSALGALNAIAGAVLLVDSRGTGLEVKRVQGHEEKAQTLWQDGPLDGRVPAGDALMRRQPLFFERRGALNQAYPELEERTGGVAAVATAVLPMFLDDRPLGALILDFREPHEFTLQEVRFLRTLTAQGAVALGRARLQQDLEARVAARTAELEEQRAALDAFVVYKEAVGHESDVRALAGQAVRTVRANLPHVSAAYYEREGNLWKAQAWSEDMAPEVVAEITAGVDVRTPNYAETVRSGTPLFKDGWDGAAQGLSRTVSHGATGFLPTVYGGETRGLFAVETRHAHSWTEREQSLIRAVVRGLHLTLERTEQTRRLAIQNAELEARTQALEGFAHLTRDLTDQSDPRAFVKRAQEVVLSLLPSGYALYYGRDGGRWRNWVQTGDVGHSGLQAFIDAGPLVGETPTVDIPWTTGQPFFQDTYAQGSDTPAEMVQHVNAAAALPVSRRGEVMGVFIAVLFEKRAWSRTDRVVLETVVGSLGLALERAESVALLERRNQELARSNAELEQFAYVASHDLQAPIRAMTSFAGLLERRYSDRLDGRGQAYLQHIVDGGEHMKRLVDDLLTFSRVHTQQRPLLPTEVDAVFDAVVRRLEAEVDGARVTRSRLPVVLADAQQLDQLLQNLISNGLKYRREGVTPEVHVRAERDGELWRFAVRDNGIGIEPQYFERIFVIFQRLHGREEYEGTGIGLAVCKKIVERHGGQIWMESTPGEGTTCYFTLQPDGNFQQ